MTIQTIVSNLVGQESCRTRRYRTASGASVECACALCLRRTLLRHRRLAWTVVSGGGLLRAPRSRASGRAVGLYIPFMRIARRPSRIHMQGDAHWGALTQVLPLEDLGCVNTSRT
jgi:hypothetical protein